MKSTGLTDSNGSEIFEGDLLIERSLKNAVQVFFNELNNKWSIDLSVKQDKTQSVLLQRELTQGNYLIIKK